ncbi:MAG: hypothetical protein IPK62_02810 [Bacteroidetes bacterium]|nr:hypothetical protein [Bacteroidota bacterium]MBK8143997.1 hypothetical protein [Bacteroidota bacterium]
MTNKIYFLFFMMIGIFSCKGKKEDLPQNVGPNYANACCCDASFSAGNGVVFIPSIFTPNSDGLNDYFSPLGNTNIAFIVDVKISDLNNNVIYAIDTAYGILNHGKWNGMNINQTLYKGVFNLSCKAIDNNNVITNLTAQSCSFICDDPNAIIQNTNCKFASMFDFITGNAPYASGENCF